jgi:hypothetical protein
MFSDLSFIVIVYLVPEIGLGVFGVSGDGGLRYAVFEGLSGCGLAG